MDYLECVDTDFTLVQHSGFAGGDLQLQQLCFTAPRAHRATDRDEIMAEQNAQFLELKTEQDWKSKLYSRLGVTK